MTLLWTESFEHVVLPVEPRAQRSSAPLLYAGTQCSRTGGGFVYVCLEKMKSGFLERKKTAR